MMDVKTDNSAVIAGLNKRIAELDKTNDTLHKLMVSGERRGIKKATEEFKDKIAELEKDNDWLFDFALGYTNIEFINESLKALKEQG
jgi:hypothetical protein